MKYDRLRLATNPPVKTPPEGFADLYIDPDTGALMKKTAAGSATQVGTTGGSLGAITVTSINGVTITPPVNWAILTIGTGITIDLGGYITTSAAGCIDTSGDGGYIKTHTEGGYIDTSNGGGFIQTLSGGYISTSGHLDTTAGGSLTTGTGDLTGPAVSGMIPAVPSYADETAANAALSSGDFYWNVALGKLKTATA